MVVGVGDKICRREIISRVFKGSSTRILKSSRVVLESMTANYKLKIFKVLERMTRRSIGDSNKDKK